MKTNWMQIVTLCLCVVLLVLNIEQGKTLEEYRQQMEQEMLSMEQSFDYTLQRAIDSIEWKIEEMNQIVEDFALEPAGLDKANQSLIANVSVTMKEWYTDAAVNLLGSIGDEEFSVPMATEGNGIYAAQVSLPAEDSGEMFLYVQVSEGGITKQERLGGWSDIFMLLPLRNSGGGWSGPDYKEGVLSSRFNIAISGPIHEAPGQILYPQFEIYKNGERVQTLEAVEDSHSSSANSVCFTPLTEEEYLWSIKCKEGDVIEIHFLCQDEYGLGYDFLYAAWTVEDEDSNNPIVVGVDTDSPSLRLNW